MKNPKFKLNYIKIEPASLRIREKNLLKITTKPVRHIEKNI